MNANHSTINKDFSFLKGGGEMGELASQLQWQQTAIGSPDHWPQCLTTSVSILLRSKLPMFLFWGHELLCFYNDAARIALLSIDKHPSALGKPASAIWPGIALQLESLKNNVLISGDFTPSKDQPGPFAFYGDSEEWTLHYNTICDNENTSGLLITVIAKKDLAAARQNTEYKYQADLQEAGIIQSASIGKNIFRNTINQVPVGFTILTGPDFVVEMANKTYLQIVDKTEESFVGRSLFDSLPEVKDAVQPLLNSVLTTGVPYHGFEFPVTLNRYGQKMTTYFNFVYQPRKEEDGSISGVIVVANEITELVRAKHQLAESEKQFRNMVMHSPIAMTIFRGKNHVVELANHVMFQQLWRKKEEEVLGKEILEVFPELREQKYAELLDSVFTNGHTHRENESIAYVDGSDGMKRFYLDYEYAPLMEQDGSVSGIMITVNDVTEKVEARQKIELAEEKAKLAIASAELGTYEIDLHTNTMHTSPRFQAIWGVTGTTDRNEYVKALHPEDLHQRKKAFDEAYATGNLDYESRVMINDDHKWVKVRGTILYNEKQEPAKILGVVQDITEQKIFSEAMEKMVQERTRELAIANDTLVFKNEELARSNVNLEQFAYAASHDMKEPIRKIHFFSDRLKDTMSEKLSDTEVRYFNRMEEATKRMGSLIDDLLSYSQISVKPRLFEAVDLNNVVKYIINDLELQIEEKKAQVNYQNLPVIQGHARQLQQAFQNLVSNALKFQKPEEPPVIHISCTRIKGSDMPFHLTPEQRRQWYYLLSITDNGIGFEQQDAEKIFHVFTRLHGNAEYKGTGIGLSIVQKVAENHGGFVNAIGQPGQGATFQLYLPIKDLD